MQYNCFKWGFVIKVSVSHLSPFYVLIPRYLHMLTHSTSLIVESSTEQRLRCATPCSVIVNMDMIVEETNAASSSWYETSGNALF